MWGTAEFVEEDPGLLQRLQHPDQEKSTGRALVFRVEAWDANCKQYITRRFSQEEVTQMRHDLEGRIAQLEKDNAHLRSRLKRNDPLRQEPSQHDRRLEAPTQQRRKL